MTNESPAPVEIPGDTQSKAWTPAVGERVSGRQAGGGDRIVTGKLRYLYTHQSEVVDDCDGVVRVVVNSTLRPADPGGWPRKQAEVEMYGMQPDVLPETLPAGTLTSGGREALCPVRLAMRHECASYDGRWSNLGGGEQPSVGAMFIDWSTVPRPPKNASGSTGHQAPNKEGCGPSPADPVVPERLKAKPCSHCDLDTCHSHHFPKLDASGFLDRDALDEQTAKRIPERDAARLRGAQSKHHQALAALDVKSGRPRYAETSGVFSTPGWESE